MTLRALIIRNPAAHHQFDAVALDEVLAVARHAGWQVDVADTEARDHGTLLAREAAEHGVDLVIANGGDGSVNEVLNALAGTPVALGVLPAGTANVWAKETHTSRDPVAAMHAIVHGERRRIDVGRVNAAEGRRAFLLMVGVGLDGVIVRRANTALKRRVGAAAYLVAGAVSAVRTKPWDVQMTIDGVPSDTTLYWMLAGNTRNYGGAVNITYRATADDGLLDLAVMHRGGLHLAPDAARVLFKRPERSPNIDYRQVHTVEIATPGIPVQLDGDSCGETPLQLTLDPLALTVIVPAGSGTQLFAQPPLRDTDAI